MLLVDSSVWVLVGRGLLDLEARVSDEDIAICPPVFQEVLHGARADEYALTRAMLLKLPMLDADVPFARFDHALVLYRQCRDEGLTIRSSVDCLIAATAIAHGVRLLHNDRDFDSIASVTRLESVRV